MAFSQILAIRQIEKIKAFYYVIANLHDNVPLSFLFDPF